MNQNEIKTRVKELVSAEFADRSEIDAKSECGTITKINVTLFYDSRMSAGELFNRVTTAKVNAQAIFPFQTVTEAGKNFAKHSISLSVSNL